VLDDAITQGAERDARAAEVVPRFLIRDLTLERIARLLLKEICEPGPDSSLSADVTRARPGRAPDCRAFQSETKSEEAPPCARG
jgi:hypothetical protein